MAKAETLKDSFSFGSLNTNLWDTVNGGQIDVLNRMLRIKTILDGNYCSLISDDLYDLEDSHVGIEVVDYGEKGLGSYEMYPLQIVEDGNNYLEMRISQNEVIYGKMVGGVYTEVESEDFDPNNHKWFRIRELSGTVFYERSANGNDWIVAHSESDPIDLSNISVQITLGTWDTELIETAVLLDNVNVVKYPKLLTFVDNFNDNHLSLTKWEDNGGGKITEENSHLVFDYQSTGDFDVITVNTYDLFDSEFRFKVVDSNSEEYTPITDIKFVAEALNEETGESVQLIFQDSIDFVKITGGGPVGGEELSETLNIFYRVRESEGTLYFETSDDGREWDEVANFESDIDLTAVRLRFTASPQDTMNTQFIIDNVNVLDYTGVYRIMGIKEVMEKGSYNQDLILRKVNEFETLDYEEA